MLSVQESFGAPSRTPDRGWIADIAGPAFWLAYATPDGGVALIIQPLAAGCLVNRTGKQGLNVVGHPSTFGVGHSARHWRSCRLRDVLSGELGTSRRRGIAIQVEAIA
jgi:hypothetical protein